MAIHDGSRVRLWTFQRCYAEILAGEENAWLPLGNMMHQFFGVRRDERAELVTEPIFVPENVTADQFRWAVWCAASVEYLCRKYDIPVPAWSLDDRYQLAEPWYYGEVLGEEEEEELRAETSQEFARRNIFCEANPYRNKYEKPARYAVVQDEQQIA